MYDPDALGATDFIARVDALHAEIDAMRPLDADQAGKAMQRLRLEWTYHSNAIEGNSLTYGETRALLMHGVTAAGKPLKDHLDIKGHKEALDYLERFVQAKEPLTLAAIRELHMLLLGEPYEVPAETPDGKPARRTITPSQFKTQPNHVTTATGERHYYASPEETPALMTDLVDWQRETWPEVEAGALHPIVFAADLHHRFAAIHPFDDGNGRMARLLMNLVLMRAGYVPAVLRQENRSAYYGALAQADGGDLGAIVQFVAEELESTLALYLRALRGDPDPNAFSKRVALLRREIETKGAEEERSRHHLAMLASGFVAPFLQRVYRGVAELKPLFNREEGTAHYVGADGTQKFVGHRLPQVLPTSDWLFFQQFITLVGFSEDPLAQVRMHVKGEAGRTHLVLQGSWKGPETHLAYGKPVEQEEALRLAGSTLDKLFADVEAAHRRVTKGRA